MKMDRKVKRALGSEKLQASDGARRSSTKPNGKHLPAAYEHIPIGIVESSLEGKYINANEEFCNIVAYEKRELLTLGIKDLTFEEDYPIDINLHQQLIAGKIPFYKLEKRYVRKDGEIAWVELTRSIVRNSHGKALYTVGAVLDVTERKRADLEIKNISRLPAENPNLLMCLTPDGKILYANNAATALLDFWKQENDQTIPSEFQKQLAEAFASGLKKEIEIEQNGKTFSCTLVPIREAGYVNFYGNDFTERKRAEQALRESEATARLLLNTAPDGVIIVNETGVVVHANAQIASLFGYQPEEVLGKSVEVLIPERFHERHQQHRRAYANYRSRRVMGLGMELFGRRKSGIEFPVDVMLTPISNIPEWDLMVTIRDNTEGKQMERALYESRKRLQILSQRLVEVQEEERRAIARELHDRVGQSLSALNINLVIMNDQISKDSKKLIGSRLDDSLHLVSETIALVRDVMSNLRPAVLDDYGLEAALQSYIDEFKFRYGIQVVLNQSDTPISRLGASLEMTFLRIAQEALMNIARHAQASQVTLSLRQENNAICLTVQDNGIGIESWQEANRPGSHGLTIMRERAEAFGGNLKVRSVPGKGTKIQVSIPIENGSQTQVQKEMRG